MLDEVSLEDPGWEFPEVPDFLVSGGQGSVIINFLEKQEHLTLGHYIEVQLQLVVDLLALELVGEVLDDGVVPPFEHGVGEGDLHLFEVGHTEKSNDDLIINLLDLGLVKEVENQALFSQDQFLDRIEGRDVIPAVEQSNRRNDACQPHKVGEQFSEQCVYRRH